LLELPDPEDPLSWELELPESLELLDPEELLSWELEELPESLELLDPAEPLSELPPESDEANTGATMTMRTMARIIGVVTNRFIFFTSDERVYCSIYL
jgi:hypothetical protein